MKKKRKYFRKQVIIDKHHIIPRCRGGADTVDNLLRLKVKRHRALHNMFGHQTLRMIWIILKEVNVRIILTDEHNLDMWCDLFGDKTKAEVLALLERVIRAKEAQRRLL